MQSFGAYLRDQYVTKGKLLPAQVLIFLPSSPILLISLLEFVVQYLCRGVVAVGRDILISRSLAVVNSQPTHRSLRVLPPVAQWSVEKLFVRSTNIDRTLMSVRCAAARLLAALCGLFLEHTDLCWESASRRSLRAEPHWHKQAELCMLTVVALRCFLCAIAARCCRRCTR